MFEQLIGKYFFISPSDFFTSYIVIYFSTGWILESILTEASQPCIRRTTVH